MIIYVIIELIMHRLESLPFASTDEARTLREYFRLWRTILPALPHNEGLAYQAIADHLNDAPGGVEYVIGSVEVEDAVPADISEASTG